MNNLLRGFLGQAFRAIDEKGCGYIETAKMNELLVSKGTPFRAKEIEAFLSVAKVILQEAKFLSKGCETCCN